MHPFDGFTYQQASMVRELLRYAKAVRWLGIDAKGLPVVQFQDVRRTTDVFAIPRRPNPSAAVEPTLPIRQLTDEDLDVIDEGSHLLICRCKRVPIGESDSRGDTYSSQAAEEDDD